MNGQKWTVERPIVNGVERLKVDGVKREQSKTCRLKVNGSEIDVLKVDSSKFNGPELNGSKVNGQKVAPSNRK